MQQEQTPPRASFNLRRWAIIFAIVIVAFTAGVLVALAVSDGGRSTNPGAATGEAAPEDSAPSPADNDNNAAPLPETTPPTPQEPATESFSPPPEPDPKDVPAQEDLTEAQTAALRSAKSTFGAVPIGRAHLIELTQAAGHDIDDVVIAIAVLDIDWDRSAQEAAHSVLEHTPSSESGLIEHLERIGFTTEQAEQAVESLNADWEEQARILAKEFHDTFRFSRDRLITQLRHEGFTSPQAEQAAEDLGL